LYKQPKYVYIVKNIIINKYINNDLIRGICTMITKPLMSGMVIFINVNLVAFG